MALLHQAAPGLAKSEPHCFLFNYQKFVLNNAASAEESGSGAASLELSGPPTAPLLGQLEHLAARVRSRELVGQMDVLRTAEQSSVAELLELNFR